MNIKILINLLINSLKSCSQLNKMRVLVFDTETTGLPKTKILNKYMLELWPYIVQFSYIIYDIDTNTIVKIKDCIIKVPDSLQISEEASKLHGITNELSATKGINIIDILEEFFEDFNSVEHVVGHNVSFDLNIIKAELTRIIIDDSNVDRVSEFKEYLNMLDTNKNIYCTMQVSIELCAIEMKTKAGKSYNKFPKLIELYEKLFQIRPNNLHNSLNDVIVCLRCFMKLKYDRDIVEHSEEIKTLIKDYL